MTHPDVLKASPPNLLGVLGGLVGMLLLSALIYLAPVLGFPFVDFPRLLGGVFTSNPEAAFWLGFWIFFLIGVFVFAPLLSYFWTSLPGRNLGFIGATVKGLIWGLVLWLVSGILLPIEGFLNRIPGLENPGFFAINLGLLAAVGILLGHLAFGLVVALIASMGQGIEPMDSIGWDPYWRADVRGVIQKREGREMPQETVGRNVP